MTRLPRHPDRKFDRLCAAWPVFLNSREIAVTTIAYRDGVLAADSLAGRSGWKCSFSETKLIRLKDGRAAAICGAAAYSMRIARWIEGGKVGDQPANEIGRLIVMNVDKSVEVYEDGGMFVERQEFGAFGSGMPPALGALIMGASAARAVEVAALVDPSTGGPVKTMVSQAA